MTTLPQILPVVVCKISQLALATLSTVHVHKTGLILDWSKKLKSCIRPKLYESISHKEIRFSENGETRLIKSTDIYWIYKICDM